MGEVDDDALDDLLSALHQRLLEAKQQAPLLLSPGVKCDREPSP
jgi:hypothetical protein